MRNVFYLGGLSLVLVLFGAGCFNQATTPEVVEDDNVIEEDQMEESMAVEYIGGDYMLDVEESSITWFGDKKIGAPHDGTIDALSGSITIDRTTEEMGSVVVESIGITNGVIVIDMDTLEATDGGEKQNDQVTTHLKSDDFFGVETYPEASFTLTDAELLGGNDVNLTGIMSIKETSEELSFDVELKQEDEDTLRLTGVITIDRSLFDVRYGSASFFDNLGDNVINDEFEITLDLVFEMPVGEDAGEEEV